MDGHEFDFSVPKYRAFSAGCQWKRPHDAAKKGRGQEFGRD